MEIFLFFQNWFLTHLDTHSSGLFQANNADFQSNITSVRVKGVDANPFERKKTRITEVDVSPSGVNPLHQEYKIFFLVFFSSNFWAIKPCYPPLCTMLLFCLQMLLEMS